MGLLQFRDDDDAGLRGPVAYLSNSESACVNAGGLRPVLHRNIGRRVGGGLYRAEGQVTAIRQLHSRQCVEVHLEVRSDPAQVWAKSWANV